MCNYQQDCVWQNEAKSGTSGSRTESSTPAELVLSEDEVHVWRAALDEPAEQIQLWRATLAADEQLRADRFYFERDRLRFIAARAILRNILSRYLAIAPGEVQFSYSDRGKPALADNEAKSGTSGLQFNVSHSNTLALYAVTRDRRVGIDVEHIRPISDIDALTKRFFSAREYGAIASLRADQKPAAFFRGWTRKEAYLKATGEGLAGLEQIEVSLTPGEPAKVISIAGDTNVCEGWSLQELKPHPDYIAAVAVERRAGDKRPYSLNCWQFTVDI